MTPLARLTLWLNPDRLPDFTTPFQQELAPLLAQHNLHDPQPCDRPPGPGVFSRLFFVESSAAVLDTARALQADLTWHEALARLGATYGACDEAPLPYDFGLYCAPAIGHAVDAGPGTHHGLWHSWSVQDGLLSATAFRFQQDDRGRLWITTSEGVACFDGAQFTHFTTEDGLPYNGTGPIVRGLDGTLWWGTDGYHAEGPQGLVRYDGTQFEVFTQADSLAGPGILALALAGNGDVWIGTSQGLSRFDGTTFHSFTQEGLPSGRVSFVYVDGADQVWLSTRDGVCRFADPTCTVFSKEDIGLQAPVWCFCEDAQGRLWLGGHDGVRCFDGHDFIPFLVEEGLGAPGAAPMLVDTHGQFWFNVYPRGICFYQDNRFTAFTRSNGLLTSQIEAVYEDDQGRLWAASNGGGISRYDGAQLTHITRDDGLPSEGLYFIRQDRAGTLWVGTFEGVCRQVDGQWQQEAPASHWANAMLDWVEARDGSYWGITHQSDVLRCQDGTWTMVYPSAIKGVNVGSLAEDSQGHIWCANSIPGVHRWDGTTWTSYTTQDGLADDTSRQVLVDRSGRVWIGADNGAISRYENGVFERISDGAALGYYSIRALQEDAQGRLWVGTAGGGVTCFDGRTFRTFTRADGVPADRVLAQAFDEEERLWIGSQGGGVGLYDGRVFQSLDRRDGLSNDVVRDLCFTPDGTAWLATEGGITTYRRGTQAPGIRLTEVLADRPYELVEQITLPVSQTFIRFAFQVQAVDRDLNYSPPLRVAVEITPDPQQQALTEALSRSSSNGEFIGESLALKRVQHQLAEVAPTDRTVLILGETGTGKGVAARAVHQWSVRRKAPFIQINCGAIPEGLVENELFGHEKGAFTGAVARKLGKVELARDGTLFLDEIGDLPLEAQSRLLRLLEERHFERVGGTQTMTAQARVVAATNRDLNQMVVKGTFREDLYFRLQVFPVRLPPLRERKADIPPLAYYFMKPMAAHVQKKVMGFTDSALALLQRYDWPGNVRELKHAVERAVIVCPQPAIDTPDIALMQPAPAATPLAVLPNEPPLTLAEQERRYLRQVLEANDWTIRGTARLLKLPESTLRNRMKRLGLTRGERGGIAPS